MDLTTHLSGIDMATIYRVKFLTLIILFLISSCRTTSNFVPSNDSQFKNFVKEYKQRNDETPHTHFAMADSDGNCRGALWADFNEEDVKKNAIDLCNSYQGCNQCKIVNFENHSVYVEQVENKSSTSDNYKTYDTSNYKREYVSEVNQKLSKPSEHSININSKNYSFFMKCDDKKIKARLNEIKSNFVDFNCNNKDYGTVQNCNFAKKYYQNFEKAPYLTCSELDKAYLNSYLSDECNKRGRKIVESFYLKNHNDHSKEIIYYCSNENHKHEINKNKNIERDVVYGVPEGENDYFEYLEITKEKYPEFFLKKRVWSQGGGLDRIYLGLFLNKKCKQQNKKLGPYKEISGLPSHEIEGHPIRYLCVENSNKNYDSSRFDILEDGMQKVNYKEAEGYNRPDFLNNAKKECLELGFKNNTEKFGECVLQLSK